MSKAEELRYAAVKIEEALAKLKLAKEALLKARSEQHVPLAIKLVGLEELYAVLTDPECTPEMYEGR